MSCSGSPSAASSSWPGFPILLQGAALVAVGWLAANGIGLGTGMPADDLMTLRKTNLTTLVVWGLWWPGMIAVALALGRVWCTVCPMELVNRIGDALARKVGWPRGRLSAFLRAGWMTVALYLVLQLFVAGLSIHRVPHFTAILLLSLIGLALFPVLCFGRGVRSARHSAQPQPFFRSTAASRPYSLKRGNRPPAMRAPQRTACAQRTATASTSGAARRFLCRTVVSHLTVVSFVSSVPRSVRTTTWDSVSLPKALPYVEDGRCDPSRLPS